MQPEYLSIGDLFSKETVFVVPLFQRPYVWNEERWELLWEDVARVAEETLQAGSTSKRHFLGSIVVQQRLTPVGQTPRREVIDGQQRLTTLQVLLKSVIDELDQDIVTSDAALPLTSLIRHRYAQKGDVEGEYKVWPTNRDRTPFRNVIDGVVLANGGAGDLFSEAYKYFRSQIRKWIETVEDAEGKSKRAEALGRVLRQDLWLIALNLAEDDQAQVIFETLNARGTPLTPGDLIKNVLLRKAQDEGAATAALYEKYWSHFDNDSIWQVKIGAGYTARPRLDFFLQQALTVMTKKAIPMSKVYDSFVSYINQSKGVHSATDHLKKINELSLVGRKIFQADESDADRAMVAVARIRAMDFSTALPVLMVLLTNPQNNNEEVVNGATMLESFLVRRMVCGLNTGMYGLFFVDVMNAVLNATSASAAIMSKLRSETSDSTRWPTDDEFSKAWQSLPVYRTLKRSRLTMILRALEGAMRNPDLTDPVSIPQKLHVEHVMPQSWQQWWPLEAQDEWAASTRRDRILHTIGNLTLLKEKLNQQLSNAPWSTGLGDSKKSALQQHGLLKLNTMLVKNEVWNEESIEHRSAELFGYAKRIWPHPDTMPQ